jgi:phage terminase large subunit-like protein
MQPRSDRLASLTWTRILTITPVGTGGFYDLTVPGERHYLAEGLWHHNSGKTQACASYFDRFMRHNPGARGGIVAPTLGDAAEACIYGPSGLMTVNPLVRVRSRAGGTHVIWPNDSEAKLFGTHSKDDVDRLRAGGNRHIYWAEELAAWRYLREAWEHMELGLRMGASPRIIASTTPKTRPKLKELMEAADTMLVRATMHDNPHLPELQRTRLIARYGGTRLERQEILGEYLEDVEGALWTYETVALARVADCPDLTQVVVAVDPSGGDEDGNDEQGIVVAGRGVDGHGYVLADRSCKLSPDGWGKRAVHAYEEFRADRLVGEVNFGGDLVVANVKVAARDLNVALNVKKISVSRGKVARAEPIAALYEQGKVHHVGEFSELESQMRNWTQDSGWSPDRLDALVFAITELNLAAPPSRPAVSSVPRGRIPGIGERIDTGQYGRTY